MDALEAAKIAQAALDDKLGQDIQVLNLKGLSNVADCFVVVACIIFAFLILFYYKEDSDFDFLRKQKNRI